MANMLPHAGLRPERVARASSALLSVRVLEGLAAWVYFNEFFLHRAPLMWTVQGGFILYLLLNLWFALSYRRGHVTRSLLGFDLVANALLLAPAMAQSGGLASPLWLLMPLKTVEYAVVFSPSVAALFLGATVGTLLLVVSASRASLLPIVSFFDLPPDRAELALGAAILTFVLGAPAAISWLRGAAMAEHGLVPSESTGTGERDGTDAVVANALLRVSDAVSRLTRIDDILERVVEIAPGSVDVDYCGIALWSEETGSYTGVVAAGRGRASDRRVAGPALSPEDAPDFEWVRRLGHCAVVPASESPQTPPQNAPAVLIAPLLSGDRFYGVMEFARRGGRLAFTQRDLRIADGVARQTAVALERARLIEDARRLVLALESTEEAILITDARECVTFVNPAFERSFGYRSEEVLGSQATDLSGDGRVWLAELGDALRRRSWRGEGTAYHRDGTSVPVMINTSLMRGDDGQAAGAVAIVEDVSEERQRQAQMQRADRLAAVGEMAAGIAHEINNALTVIFSQTEDVARLDAAGLKKVLGQIDGQARRIAEIVQGVLGFARPRPPHVQPTDVAAVTVETLDLVRRDLIRQGVELVTEFDDDVPRASADPQQLQQVLWNLYRNATQAMASSERKQLRVQVRSVDEYVGVLVTDTGGGVAVDAIPRVFDPFFSTKPDGSGLGLSVSYAIARAHGGDLQASSDPGQGTTFTLRLPVDRSETYRPLARALLVDDDPEVAEAIAAMLKREGLQVVLVGSGGAAMRLIEGQTWDVIFLDVRLPDLSGPEVYAELQRCRPDLAPRVAFVTGGLWRSESRLREELPPQPVLAKPCTQEDVRHVLRQLRNRAPEAA